MDFRKLTDDMNIISALGDNPNADNALTPSGLKAKFDEAALKIKHYLNEVLIPDLYTAVESEEFRGQPGLSPTVEAERFQDSTGSGVKLVITTPVPPDSGLVDSIISVPLYDGANGVTPKIRNVDIEVLEYGADASAEITGPTNNLNLLLKIPRGEPGRDGQTPRNWLDNSEFNFAVNQRGSSSYAYVRGDTYGVDRWMLMNAASSMEVTSTGAVICRGTIAQNLSSEAKTKLYARTVTAAVKDAYGLLYIASGNFTEGFQHDSGDVRIMLSEGMFSVEIKTGAMSYPRMVLYEGQYTAETLPDYQYKGYAAELQECRRYYIDPYAVDVDVKWIPENTDAGCSASVEGDKIHFALDIPKPSAGNAAQPDWNQNDPTAPDYIANRTHYEYEGVQEASITADTGSSFDVAILDKIYEQRKTAKYKRKTEEYFYDSDIEGSRNFYISNGEDVIEVRISGSSLSFRLKDSSTAPTVTITYEEEVTKIHKIDEKYLPDGAVNKKPYVIDSEAYTYGDDALAAILEGRQVLIKVPNKNGNTIFSNFMPVLQYQLPNSNNNYLIMFYLKDGIAENIMAAMRTGSFDGVYGVIEMMLSQSYAECPLKVSPIK